MAFSGGVQAVDRVRRDLHRRVVPEGHVGRRQVVVDRLGHSDTLRAVVLQGVRDAERVLSADRDERVEPAIGEVLQHLVDPAVELERVRTGRADDRASAGQDSRDCLRAEIAEIPVDEAAPAVGNIATQLLGSLPKPVRLKRCSDKPNPSAPFGHGAWSV